MLFTIIVRWFFVSWIFSFYLFFLEQKTGYHDHLWRFETNIKVDESYTPLTSWGAVRVWLHISPGCSWGGYSKSKRLVRQSWNTLGLTKKKKTSWGWGNHVIPHVTDNFYWWMNVLKTVRECHLMHDSIT